MAIPFLSCMVAAAAFYHLPPRVLPSIQAVEGGKLGSVRIDADGSQDLGLMQVNTRWLQALSLAAGMTQPAVRLRLIGDGCFNIAAAGAIMRTYLNESGGNLILAIGYYHSHTPALRQDYQARVLQSATSLFVRPVPRRAR